MRALFRISLFLFAIAVLSSNAEDLSKTNNWIPSGSLSFSLQERYIGIRTSRVLYDGISLMSDLNVNLPKGFYVDIWDHHGILERRPSKQPEELDLTFGWRRNLPMWGLEADLNTTYLNNTPLDRWWNGNAWSQAVMLSKSYKIGEQALKPQFRIEWISRANDVGGGSYLLMPNISHVWKQPFGIKPLNFSEQLFMVHDDGFKMPKNDTEGYFLRWNVGLRWSLSKTMTLTLPGFTAQIPIHRGNDGRGQALSWSSSLSFSF